MESRATNVGGSTSSRLRSIDTTWQAVRFMPANWTRSTSSIWYALA